MALVDQILRATSPEHGHVLFTLAPKEVMWWVRRLGSISIISVGLAVHETNHAVNGAISNCMGGDATFSFQGKTIRTEHRAGDTPRYGVLDDHLPGAFRSRKVGSRYVWYVERNGASPASSFAHLMDEFVAYTGAAEVELAIVRSEEYSWLLSRELDAFDGNVGGMVDFMLYMVSYLKTIRLQYPEAYRRLQQQPKMLNLIQTTWTAAEGSLKVAHNYAHVANRVGVVTVSREALATVYSDHFLEELDRLGISHDAEAAWPMK